MMKKTLWMTLLILASVSRVFAGDAELYQKLQDVSVTVKAGNAEGSGADLTPRLVSISLNLEEIK